MVNTDLLNQTIDASGLKRKAIAERLGLSEKGLYNKVEGITEFKGSELTALKVILHLSDSEWKSIFFNQ